MPHSPHPSPNQAADHSRRPGLIPIPSTRCHGIDAVAVVNLIVSMIGNCTIWANIRQWNFPRLRVFQMACSKEWSHRDLRHLNLNCRWISSFIKCFVKAWDGTCPSKRLWICLDSKTDLNLGSTNQTNQTTSKNYYILTPACADDPVWWAYFSTGWHNH